MGEGGGAGGGEVRVRGAGCGVRGAGWVGGGGEMAGLAWRLEKGGGSLWVCRSVLWWWDMCGCVTCGGFQSMYLRLNSLCDTRSSAPLLTR